MSRAKRKKPHIPSWGGAAHIPPCPQGGEDWGSDTPRARAGTVVEPIVGDANRRRRRRRLPPWEDMEGLGKKLLPRQVKAAEELHRVHAETMRSPAPSSVFVDATPDYGWGAVQAAERQHRRARLWATVPSAQAAVVFHVCGLGLALRDREQPFSRNGYEAAQHTAELQVALDIVANGLGY